MRSVKPPRTAIDRARTLSHPPPSSPFMASTNISIGTDPVKQFSVFAENRVGRLYDLTALLKDNNVHVMALTVLDTTDSSILRLIVDDPDKARELMINNDFPYTEVDVLAVEINDEADLKDVLAALLEAEINIHYIYSFIKRPEGRSALAMNIEDTDVAAQSLNNRGFKVLTQRDISR
jgi:hypothetical protein